MPAPDKTDCVYTKQFCEENIWKLVDLLLSQAVPATELDVVFISNQSRQVAVFNQQRGSLHQPLIWDYHVVLLHTTATDFFIYDFETLAHFPCPASHYFRLSFPPLIAEAASYSPLFRLIPASEYHQHFSSDRSHMLSHIDATAFPHYPAIQPANNAKAITLQQYWDFNLQLPDSSYILDLPEFFAKTSHARYTPHTLDVVSDNRKK
ncbi:MAG: protein N-terminal glutamine amidohydrolase [Gammaproteobacteria bacterium]|nr:protein N-terminal glutamine amidohydrolase [Gammaproteobacteria bacterium]